jgi:hypothetical protein
MYTIHYVKNKKIKSTLKCPTKRHVRKFFRKQAKSSLMTLDSIQLIQLDTKFRQALQQA